MKGIVIKVHWSWFAAFFLIFLAVYQFFTANLESTHPVYAALSLAVTLAFFLSVLLHELTHSLVARKRGVQVPDITLFIFGGIARIGREADTPSAELRMAAAGPLFSFSAFLAFTGLALLTGWRGWDTASLAFTILAMVNFGLTFFNLLPGFPLDGGRILRALLWKRWNDPVRSTVVSARIGQALGILLVAIGLVSPFFDLYQSGYDMAATVLWLAFIGSFLFQLARRGGRQSLVHMRLSSTGVAQEMRPLDVIDQGLPPTEGPSNGHFPRSIPTESDASSTIEEDASLLEALKKMEAEGKDFLWVVREGSKVGLILREDILERSRREDS